MSSSLTPRVDSFSQAVAPPAIIKDSRFGLRQLPKSVEEPSVFSYATPGKGPNGEHQT